MSLLNALYSQLPFGSPVTSAELAALGVSADLAVHYVRAGWLTRLARGVFTRPDAALGLHPSLQLLERRVTGLHVGGASALDWHGVRHHVLQRPPLHLYGWVSTSLPSWFTERFPSRSRRLRLFDEPPEAPLRVSRFERQPDAPLVSEPERASSRYSATWAFAGRCRMPATCSRAHPRCAAARYRSCSCSAGR